MENTKGLLVFCGIISALIFAYYLLPIGLVQGDGDVTVSATVGTTLSCSASTGSTAFGTLTTAAVSTSTPDVTVTMSANAAGGGTLKVNDVGCTTSSVAGLYSATADYLLTSTAATLAGGTTAGYGLQATTNANGSGGTLTIDAAYDKSGDAVGALSTSTVNISASSEPISDRETVVKHKAAVTEVIPAATDYADTITYSCVGN